MKKGDFCAHMLLVDFADPITCCFDISTRVFTCLLFTKVWNSNTLHTYPTV